jgi:hypothetical protein
MPHMELHNAPQADNLTRTFRNRSANCKAGGGPFHAERLGVKVASG